MGRLALPVLQHTSTMAEETAPKVAKAPKVKKTAKPAAHPPYANMIVAAIKALKDKKGSGSFKLPAKEPAAKKPKAKKAKKPKAAKKPAAKKAAKPKATKKPAAKKPAATKAAKKPAAKKAAKK